MSQTPEQLRDKLEDGLAKAATAQRYRLPDGTEVVRANVADLVSVREKLKIEEARAKRGAKFVPVALRQG
jgi:hypothetical protein